MTEQHPFNSGVLYWEGWHTRSANGVAFAPMATCSRAVGMMSASG
ncbi:hypothetical protein [Reticulibacter mediterranei]|nr:hypothetical protein [Reticulibacter mediterranei]